VGTAFTGSREERTRARRRTFRSLTDLRTQLQRELAEPAPISTRAAAWWPLIVQLQRAADAVMESVVAVHSGAGAPTPTAVEALRRAIRQIDDLVSGSCSEATATITDGVLAPVTQEVDTACWLVRQAAVRHRPYRGRT
jgi:hypothetical protein